MPLFYELLRCCFFDVSNTILVVIRKTRVGLVKKTWSMRLSLNARRTGMCWHIGSFTQGWFKCWVAETGSERQKWERAGYPVRRIQGNLLGESDYIKDTFIEAMHVPDSLTHLVIPNNTLSGKSYPHFGYSLPSWSGFVFSKPKPARKKYAPGLPRRGIGNLPRDLPILWNCSE